MQPTTAAPAKRLDGVTSPLRFFTVGVSVTRFGRAEQERSLSDQPDQPSHHGRGGHPAHFEIVFLSPAPVDRVRAQSPARRTLSILPGMGVRS